MEESPKLIGMTISFIFGTTVTISGAPKEGLIPGTPVGISSTPAVPSICVKPKFCLITSTSFSSISPSPLQSANAKSNPGTAEVIPKSTAASACQTALTVFRPNPV